jgi:hypothetical protein
MRAVPMHLREASYAMGATRFQTSVRVVFPAAFSGVASAYVLGFSRAIGETMVVAIAAGMQPNLTFNPLEPAATITAYIVQVSLGDLPHGSVGYQTIFAAGLTLMLMTLVFNIGRTPFAQKVPGEILMIPPKRHRPGIVRRKKKDALFPSSDWPPPWWDSSRLPLGVHDRFGHGTEPSRSTLDFFPHFRRAFRTKPVFCPPGWAPASSCS